MGAGGWAAHHTATFPDLWRRHWLAMSFLLIEPGDGTDLGPVSKHLVATRHIDRGSMAHENLAGKIQAQSTVLETSLHNTTLEDRALALACLSQLIPTTTTGACQIGIA
jgi:hypothetical protein